MAIYYNSKPVDVDTTFDPTSENAVSGIAVQEAIDEAVQSMYKPGGSILFNNLPELSADVLGFVYNIIDAFTTDTRFIEGAGTECAAGTNVAVVNIGTSQNPVYKFDIFASGATQIQSDWAQTDTSAVDFIKNKPTILTVTAGTGIDITNNVISVTSPTLTNTATGSNSLTILGDANSVGDSVNIGVGSKAYSSSVAVGCYAKATGLDSVAVGANVYTHEKMRSVAIGELIHTWGDYNISIGYGSTTFGNRTIQIGEGRNDEANTVKFGNGTNNWKLLDLTTGLIPDARLSTNVQTTTNLVTSVSSSSTDTQYPSAKLLYDTVGNIEATLDAIIAQGSNS